MSSRQLDYPDVLRKRLRAVSKSQLRAVRRQFRIRESIKRQDNRRDKLALAVEPRKLRANRGDCSVSKNAIFGHRGAAATGWPTFCECASDRNIDANRPRIADEPSALCIEPLGDQHAILHENQIPRGRISRLRPARQNANGHDALERSEVGAIGRGKEDEVMAIREKLRMLMERFILLQPGDLSRFSAGCGHIEQAVSGARAEQKDPAVVPRTAEAFRCLTDWSDRSAGRAEPLQLAVCEESNLPTVWRPEGETSTFGIAQDLRIESIEDPDREHRLTVP